MSLSYRQKISSNLVNIAGWRTTRKIVVIESDDWGTVRMASANAYNFLVKQHYPVDESAFNSNDALESNDDMELVFETLSSVKDSNGNPAVITANNIVANPAFEKIEASGFREYFCEPFTETLKRYPQHDRVEKLYREGIEKKVWKPQFHGREHVNINRWLEALQAGHAATRMVFGLGMFSVHAEREPAMVNELMDALDGDSTAQLDHKQVIVAEGLQLFKSIWGFHSKSFIAPCYIWKNSLEQVLAANGVRYIQGTAVQLEPTDEPGYRYTKKYHYQGQRNDAGQRYLVRNAFFEPSTNLNFDWVDDCLHRIETAFKWHKPAIISTHRVNFIGFIREQNRSNNLYLFSTLLKKIKQRWPLVEFMSSDQLGDLMQ